MTTPWVRAVLAVAGVAAIGWGIALVASGGVTTDPTSLAIWLAGGVVAHDVLVAPLVVLLGWLAAPRLPGALRGPAAVVLLVAGAVTLMSMPLWLGQLLGRLPTAQNPTVDPFDYPRNLATVLAAVLAAVVVGAGAAAWLRRRRGPDGAEPGTSDPRAPSAPRAASPDARRG